MKTVRKPSDGKYQERGSKFISRLFPAESEEAFQRVLREISKEHHAARHVCWAFRMNDSERSTDAGEPSGTAGLPLLNLLRGHDLVLCGLIVVRYFGGVKLGTGNLARAYRKAGEDALEGAALARLGRYVVIGLTVPYDRMGEVHALISRHSLKIIEKGGEETAHFSLGIPEEAEAAVLQAFIEVGMEATLQGEILVRG